MICDLLKQHLGIRSYLFIEVPQADITLDDVEAQDNQWLKHVPTKLPFSSMETKTSEIRLGIREVIEKAIEMQQLTLKLYSSD